MKNLLLRVVCIIFSLFLLPGCSSDDESPNLGGLYSELASQDDPNRNPVIVIPGVLGSRLVERESGEIVWGAIGRGLENPKRDEEKRRLALPMAEHAALHELRDKVIADQALDKIVISLYGLQIELDTYSGILNALGVGGFISEGQELEEGVDYGNRQNRSFQFAYDWRRDLRESARELHEYILEKRALVQKEIERTHGIKNKDVKFNIIAHSMGGLLTRYYLRYGNADLTVGGETPEVTWAGSKYVEQVILIGTPSAGSIESFQNLVEGTELAPGLPSFDAAILGTMPAIYQLLPRARHGHLITNIEDETAKLDPLDPELWERMGWGLANPDQDPVLEILLPGVIDKVERRRIALEHLNKSLQSAKAFADALDVPATPPAGLSINLIAGDAVETANAMRVNMTTGELEEYSFGPGDGKVLRSSALMDERRGSKISGRLITPIHWDNVLFLFSDHLGLTKDPVFIDNILYILLEQPLDHRG